MPYSPAIALLLTVAAAGAVTAAEPGRRASDPLGDFSASIRKVARAVSPAVVEILVRGYTTRDDGEDKASGALSLQNSSGSGVIVDPDGYIVTNSHVVEGALSVKVVVAGPQTSDGSDPEAKTLDARILGSDRDFDLALLKVDASGLPALPLGEYGLPQQGDVVLAVGSPLLLRNSLTMGVVSAPARLVHDEDLIRHIQTDAAINPGDSGGALVDTAGRLVGITTSIETKSGGSEGIGFAVPEADVREVYRQLRESGTVKRGYIGVFTQSITPALAAGLDLPARHGALVGDVEPESVGDIAGLKRRDIIVGVNQAEVTSSRQFNSIVYRSLPGEKLTLSVLRGAGRLEVQVQTAARPATVSSLASLMSPEKSMVQRLGIFCMELSGDTAELFPGLRRHYGLVVAAKSSDGLASSIDLKPGDVIHSINNLPIASLDLFRERIDALKRGDAVALQVEREGRFQYVAFDIE